MSVQAAALRAQPAVLRAALEVTNQAFIIGSSQNRLWGDVLREGSEALYYTPLYTITANTLPEQGVEDKTTFAVTSGTSLPVWTFFHNRADEQLQTLVAAVQVELSLGSTLNLSVYSGESKSETPTRPTPNLLQPEVAWVSSTYELVASGSATAALRAMYWGVEDLLARRNFALLNKVVQDIALDRLTPDVMVGFVRSTYRARLVLPAWSGLLDKIEAELGRRNVLNRKALLVGLRHQGRR